jgi:MFS family permease
MSVSTTNRRLFYYALTSALAGFLFGFDTVVISGAEQTIQRLWGLSPGVHGFAMGAALYGTVLGSLLGSWPADRFGRRPTLLAVGALFLVSALASALAPNVELFIIARFIGASASHQHGGRPALHLRNRAARTARPARGRCSSSTSCSAS